MRTGGFKKKELPKTFTIYFWEHDGKHFAASPVMTKDGLKEVYRFSFEKEKDKKQNFLAKSQLRKVMNNTLNAINWYGKKVLDDKGNIDLEKFKQLTIVSGYQAAKNKVDIDVLYKILKFPEKKITFQKARELNLI